MPIVDSNDELQFATPRRSRDLSRLDLDLSSCTDGLAGKGSGMLRLDGIPALARNA